MQEPVAPRFEDFRLTQATYKLVPTTLSARFKKIAIDHRAFQWGALVVAVVSVGVGIWLEPPSGLITFVLGSFVWVIGGFLIAAFTVFLLSVVAKILAWLEDLVFKTFSPLYRAARAYDHADAQYESDCRIYERWLAKRQEDYWRSLNGVQFERELAALFRKIGFESETTTHTSDGGADIVLRKGGSRTVVQCKAHKSKVSIGTARELAQVMRDFEADRAIIACLEGVTKPTAEYIKDKGIEVLDVREIVELQRQYG